MVKTNGTVTLLTDFGLLDPYVGAMKGVMLSVDSKLNLVDISHEIPLGDIAAGSYVLSEAAFYFPKGTVHCAVVDPGVGSQRAALVVEAGDHFFVGPDNGLFTGVIEGKTGVEVNVVTRFQVKGAQTFHGRDLFAPVAARLASGMEPNTVGPVHKKIVKLPGHRVSMRDGKVSGRVVHVDSFGNLITNITPLELGMDREEATVEVNGVKIQGLTVTFSSRSSGASVAYWGSSGRLEIAVRDGSAADELGVQKGAEVTCKKNES